MPKYRPRKAPWASVVKGVVHYELFRIHGFDSLTYWGAISLFEWLGHLIRPYNQMALDAISSFDAMFWSLGEKAKDTTECLVEAEKTQ